MDLGANEIETVLFSTVKIACKVLRDNRNKTIVGTL